MPSSPMSRWRDRRELRTGALVSLTLIGAATLASLPYVHSLQPDSWSATALWRWPLAMSKCIAEVAALAIVVYMLSFRGWVAALTRGVVIAAFFGGMLAQYFALRFGGDFLSPGIIAQAELAKLYVQPWTITLTVAVGALFPLAYELLAWKANLRVDLRRGYGAGLVVTVLIFGVVRAGANLLPAANLARQAVPLAPRGHVQALWSATREALQDQEDKTVEPQIELDASDIAAAAAYGIEVDPSRELPFVKDWIYREPLPFATKPGGKPNVILIFGESLSARFLSPYNPKQAAVTPNVHAFARNAMVVRGVFNHTFPTITGLIGQLCSVHPHLGHFQWHNAKFKLHLPKDLCLAHVLTQMGFETSFFGATPPSELFIRDQILASGFERALFFEDLLAAYLPSESPSRLGLVGGYGNSDRQMFASAARFLGTRPRSDRPFFLTVSTLETHPGLDVVDGEEYGDGISPLLNRVANFDRNFGVFMESLRKSPYADDTIVILTADHAHAPGTELDVIVANDGTRTVYDEVALIISDPTHELPSSLQSHGTTIDLAPSLLQLLNAPQQRNAFLGLSLFSDRPKTAGGLGLVFGGMLLVNRAEGPAINERSIDVCNVQPANRPEYCGVYRTIRYAFQVMAADRLWRDE